MTGRRCLCCTRALTRKEGEPRRDFEARRLCDRGCMSRHYAAIRKGVVFNKTEGGYFPDRTVAPCDAMPGVAADAFADITAAEIALLNRLFPIRSPRPTVLLIPALTMPAARAA